MAKKLKADEAKPELFYITEQLRPLAVPVVDLVFDPANARLHPEDNMRGITASLRVYGQRKPIVVNKRNGVVEAGNGTLQGAIALKWSHIAVVYVDDDPSTAAGYSIADNRTAELADWDTDALDKLLREIDTGDEDLQAMLSKLAEDEGVVSLDDEAAGAGGTGNADEVPEPPVVPVTKPGDVWLMGEHRVMCGSSRDDANVTMLLAGHKANICFTSPPYASQRKYDESSGFKPIHPDEYVEWWDAVQKNVAVNLESDGSFFVNIKPCADGLDTHLYVMDLVVAHVRRWKWHWATEFCWERTGVPKGVTRRFKNQFEPVYQFSLNEWKMRPQAVRHPSNDVPMSLGKGSGNTGWADRQGKGGVIASNRRPRREGKSSTKSLSEMQGEGCDVGEVLETGMAFPGNRLPPFTGSHEALGHAAAFPVGLPSFFILAFTDEHDIVYEPFCGSGSTLIAAEKLSRRCFGMEISPQYVDVIVSRWMKFTGKTAVLESTGEPFVVKS